MELIELFHRTIKKKKKKKIKLDMRYVDKTFQP